MGDVKWRQVNSEPVEYAIQQGPHGDEFVRLLDNSYLSRPVGVAMFDAPESWKMNETEKVVALIHDIQCWRLGNWDGCCCSNFSIRNVDVEISCGKGGPQAVHVSSNSMDYDDVKLLQPIMDEVIRQVTEQSGRGGSFAQHLRCAQ